MIRRKEVIGNQTLILGDCLEVMPTLGRFDAVVTSPPYGQQRDYGAKISDWRALVSGALTSVPAHAHTQMLCNLGLIHREGEVVRYWDGLLADMAEAGWRTFGWYVWDQMSGMAGDWQGRLAPSFEFVFHFNRAARKVNKTKPTLGGRLHSGSMRKADGSTVLKSHDGKAVQPFKIPDSVIRTVRETEPGENAKHPARFPVRFATELIEPFTSQGETVLDCFMGSGTTLVACQRMGRQGTGIELDPDYFEIACRRVDESCRQPDLFVQPPAPAPEQAKLWSEE